MVKEYEESVLPPPTELRDDYKSVTLTKPRTNKPVSAPRTYKPIPKPRTIIKETDKALKNYTKSFEVNIIDDKYPLLQLQNTRN